MEELEVTEIYLSKVYKHPEARCEAEFYLAPDGITKNYILGEDAIQFVQYGTSDELNEEGIGYPTLRLNEISNGFAETADKYCASLSAEEFSTLQLKKDDVLICRTNGNPQYVGKSALVTEDTPSAFASYLYKARPKQSIITPATLMVFLNSANGRREIEKHSIRSNQVNYSPERLRQGRIPLFEKRFMALIDKSVDLANGYRRESLTLSKSGSDCLLSALNLTDWQPPEQLTYSSQSSLAFAAGRLDAEYYQPKYDDLFRHLKEKSLYWRQVKDICVFNARGKQPDYYDDGELPVINSRHILEYSLDYDNFERTYSEKWTTLPDARVLQNDILTYTTGANVGRTSPYLETNKALASNHVNILRLQEENPIYVAAVMNSMIGRMQTQRLITGSAQAELYPTDIDQFIIPFIDQNAQQEIIHSVLTAHTARKTAKALLEAAKRAVEIAIEDSETAAVTWLQEESTRLGITL